MHYKDKKPQPNAVATPRGWEVSLKGTNPDDNLSEVLVAIRKLDTKIAIEEDPFLFEPYQWELFDERPPGVTFEIYNHETFGYIQEHTIHGEFTDGAMSGLSWQGTSLDITQLPTIPFHFGTSLYLDPEWAEAPNLYMGSMWCEFVDIETGYSVGVTFVAVGYYEGNLVAVSLDPGGMSSTILPVPEGVELGQWVDIEMRVLPDRITFYVNGVNMFNDLEIPEEAQGKASINRLLLLDYNATGTDYVTKYQHIFVKEMED